MYLNVVQLAESFGVEERTVENWVRDEGLPHVQDRGRLLFDRAQVATWAAARGLASKAGFLAPERPKFSQGRRLEPMLRHGGIWRNVAAREVIEIFERVVATMPGASPEIGRLLAQRLRTSGNVTWAPVGGGFALPHLRSPVALGRDSGTFAIVLLRDSLLLSEAPADGVPVNRLLFFIAPSPRAHLELLAQLSGALTRGDLRRLVLEGAPDTAIFAALAASESTPGRAGTKS
jgi:PTS system nitrogen regulatory IIA component